MKISKNIPLKRYSSFNLGGNADFFVSVSSVEELREAIHTSRAMGIPYLVAGEFSNILFSDTGFRGLIIKNNIKGYEFFEKNGAVYVGVGAGENWDSFVLKMVSRGLYGIENLSGIPGSVGATPIQNVGAYGTEVSNLISWVEVLNTDTLEVELFSNRQCEFGYRSSFFKTEGGKKYIVTEVGFKLKKEGSPNISYKDLKNYFNENDTRPTLDSVRNAVVNVRSKKFPNLNKVGCAGSFFKNPIVDKQTVKNLQEKYPEIPYYQLDNDMFKIPTAWLLEHVVPWKGVNRKTVGVHDAHSLVLVHYGGGKASEIKKLADEITHSVSGEANILISPEVSLVGEF